MLIFLSLFIISTFITQLNAANFVTRKYLFIYLFHFLMLEFSIGLENLR